MPINCPPNIKPKCDITKLEKKVSSYINTYIAYCSYYDIPVSSFVIYYVENLEHKGIREFNISEVPILENLSSPRFNLEPVIMALKYNKYFLSIVVNDISRKEIGFILAEVIKTNTTLTKIVVSNTDIETNGLAALSTSLRENKHINIEVLDISNQKSFDNRMMHILSISFSVYPHSITHLNLSKNSCSTKGLTKLFTSFQMNYSFSLGILHLNLSGNKFDESVDAELEKWIDKVQQHARLQELILSNVGYAPFKSISKMKVFPYFTTLDISHNKIETNEAKLLCNFLKESKSIQNIDLSDSFEKYNIDLLMDGIKSMKRTDDISINLSSNPVLGNDGKWVKTLQTSKVSHLNISNIHFKDFVLEDIVASLKFASNLTTLIINNCKTKPKRNETLFNFFNYNKLRKLSFNGSFTPESIHTLLENIPSFPNFSIQSLNIGNNFLGDASVLPFCSIIREDKSLEELYCDGNNFSMSGWLSIYQALVINTKLKFIEYPMNDFNAILSSLTNQTKKSQMVSLIFDFQSLLQKLDTKSERGRFVVQNDSIFDIPAPLKPSQPITVPSHLTNQQNDIKMEDNDLSQSDSDSIVDVVSNAGTSSHIHLSEVFPNNSSQTREKANSVNNTLKLSTHGKVPPPLPKKPLRASSLTVKNLHQSSSIPDIFSGKYEQYDEEVDMDEPVRRATINELIIRLSHEKTPDIKFMHALLMTYRANFEPEELFERLAARYFMKPPRGLNEQEQKQWNDQKLKNIRLRVINSMKRWIEAHCHDFIDYPELATKLKLFLQCEEVQKNNGTAANQLITLLERNMESTLPELISESTLKELMPKINSLKEQNVFLTFSVQDVSEALCIVERDLYCRLQMKEFLNQSWNKGTAEERDRAAPTIRAMINLSNRVTTWCATEILKQSSASSRGKAITYFIKLGIDLRSKNNFNGVMEMYAALSLSAIMRLKKSWEHVKPKYKQAYEEFSELANSSQSFGNLRKAIKESSTPLIPYLGLYLTDLVFIEEGNPETFDEDGVKMVNFRKSEMLAEVLLEIQNFQESKYTYQTKNPALNYLFLTYEPKSERELYKWSLEVEKREDKKR